MSAEYDLVVLGNTAAAVRAAKLAARWRARVALVAPLPKRPSCWGRDEEIGLAFLASPVLADARAVPSLASLQRYGDLAGESLARRNAPAALAACGIDVILEEGAFCRRSPLTFQTESRTLRSRAFVLAPRFKTVVPTFEGLREVPYLSRETFWRLAERDRPLRKAIVLGSDPGGIEMAQVLNRLGTEVATIARAPQLLPREDSELAALLQAHLEAEGIRILTGTVVSQVKYIQGEIWVQAGDRALETEALFLATGRQPDFDRWNLEAAGLQGCDGQLSIAANLQTEHPRLYALPQTLGGYSSTAVGCREAETAVRNALFFPWRRVDRASVPFAVFSQPELARIGLTETQARDRHPKDTVVLRQTFDAVPRSCFAGEVPGFCKLVARRNGRLLGAHCFAPRAVELLRPLALLLARGGNLRDLDRIAFWDGTAAQIYASLFDRWQTKNLAKR